MKTKHARSYASLGDIAERKLDAKKRSIDVIASTMTEDAHGTVIEQDWKLARFEANPVCLFDHNSSGFFDGLDADEKLPIARCTNTRVDGNQLKSTIVFPAAGRNELSDMVWMAIEDGRLNATSVGFRPGKVTSEKLPDGRERYRLSECELHEISIVVLPSNPEAVMERSLLAKLADRAKMTGCSMDDCVGPEDCVDIDCPCGCHASRATPKTTTPAQIAPTENRNMNEIIARMLGCASDDASIVAALEVLKTRAAEPKVEAVAGEVIEVPSFDEERRVLTAQIETATASVRSLADSLGVATDAPSADVTKAILALQSRAKVADELEPVVATLTGEVAKLEGDVAVREVDFLIKRGKHYSLSLDERSRKALAAYRKADPKGFAEDYKPALDGLRAFDESELFERVAADKPRAEPVVPSADPADDFEARVVAYGSKHNVLRSVAIDAVLRGGDLG